MGVVYRKKFLPIAWTVVAQKNGYLPEKVRALVPEEAKLILPEDGEFARQNRVPGVPSQQKEGDCGGKKTVTAEEP